MVTQKIWSDEEPRENENISEDCKRWNFSSASDPSLLGRLLPPQQDFQYLEKLMNTKDKQDFNRARLAIFKLMSDGRSHKATTIIKTANQREGLRRLRELRQRDDVEEIKCFRNGESRDYLYKMILK